MIHWVEGVTRGAVIGLSIAVMRNDKLVYAAGFGVADKESGMPVSPRHRFRIASVSKPITHVAVVNLANTTSLELGDRVYARSVQLHGEITPRMAEEGKRVFEAYLGLYLPPFLAKRSS